MKYSFRLCIAGTAASFLPIVLATSDGDFPRYTESAGEVMAKLVGGQTYERVYLQYHRCVWSEFGNGVEEYENGCEGDGNEDLWYAGQTQCYRANVAYSLYGIPYGQNIPKHPCQRKNFINSYFSNHGVEYFSNSMGIDYGDATDTCVVSSQGDDDFYANHKFGGENNGMLYPTYSSYTTACSANGKFVQGLFEGAYCSVRDGIETLETLDDFNDALEEMNCVQVYDAANGGGNFEDDDNGNRKLEDQSNVASGLSSLLSYSTPCSMLEYPQACPDPHGAKQWFEFLPDSQKPWWTHMNWMDILGCILLFFAVLFVLFPYCYFDDNKNNASGNDLKKPKRRFCLRNRKKEGKQRRFWFFRWRRRVDNSNNAN